MTDHKLAELIGTIHLDGWCFTSESRNVRVQAATSPRNARDDGEFNGLGESFNVPTSWPRSRVVNRIFATVQYLTDHELRETFMVGENRPFDAHTPPVTGRQHDWWVEEESAVRGF